jgi:hypothetical protein
MVMVMVFIFGVSESGRIGYECQDGVTFMAIFFDFKNRNFRKRVGGPERVRFGVTVVMRKKRRQQIQNLCGLPRNTPFYTLPPVSNSFYSSKVRNNQPVLVHQAVQVSLDSRS